uniref:SWIM-type domain-containing protein n=1 Tax=Oscillatoriales cyanobacterium SpSt-418 TaxID=2282169 RepID=A0A7C3PFC3_9CYAN
MIPKLSEATIRYHTTAQSFERGQDYCRADSVNSLVQRGNTLSAKVEGSEVESYRITIQFDKGGITHAFCTCPYEYEGWCKHIVATLLTCLHQPDQTEQRPELAKVLASLNRRQLETIVQNLANEQPEWMDAVEVQIALLTQSKTQKSQKATRRTTVDSKPIERQVERIINRYVEQWDDEPALDEIREIIQKADKFLEQGDGNNALIILGAIARAYVQDWMNLDGSSGESGIFFEELDGVLTEAMLSTELSESERQQWQKELKNWQKEVDNYGVDSFEMSLAALEQGWDYPPLREVLQGNITELGAWQDEAPQQFSVWKFSCYWAEYLALDPPA